jgi:hypothetical protein
MMFLPHFQPEPDLAVPPLLDFFHIQGQTLDTSRESYYPNITGYVRGNAQFYNMTPTALEKNDSLSWRQLAERYVAGVNVTDMVEMASTWNWTASNRMVMTLHEKKPVALQNGSVNSQDLIAVHVGVLFSMLTVWLTIPRLGWNLRMKFLRKRCV